MKPMLSKIHYSIQYLLVIWGVTRLLELGNEWIYPNDWVTWLFAPWMWAQILYLEILFALISHNWDLNFQNLLNYYCLNTINIYFVWYHTNECILIIQKVKNIFLKWNEYCTNLLISHCSYKIDDLLSLIRLFIFYCNQI